MIDKRYFRSGLPTSSSTDKNELIKSPLGGGRRGPKVVEYTQIPPPPPRYLQDWQTTEAAWSQKVIAMVLSLCIYDLLQVETPLRINFTIFD